MKMLLPLMLSCVITTGASIPEVAPNGFLGFFAPPSRTRDIGEEFNHALTVGIGSIGGETYIAAADSSAYRVCLRIDAAYIWPVWLKPFSRGNPTFVLKDFVHKESDSEK